jgi:hypothetical protein
MKPELVHKWTNYEEKKVLTIRKSKSSMNFKKSKSYKKNGKNINFL